MFLGNKLNTRSVITLKRGEGEPAWKASARRILASAIRGIPDLELVMASPPTITIGNGTSTLGLVGVGGWTANVGPTNSPPIQKMDDQTKFRPMGSRMIAGAGSYVSNGMSINTGGGPRAVSGAGWAFRTSAPAFDFCPNSTGATPLKWTIYVTEAGVRRRAATDDGGVHATVTQQWIKCDFGSSADRIIEIYTNSSLQGLAPRGICVTSGYTAEAAPLLTNEANIVIVGDSHTDHVVADFTNNIKFTRPDFMAQKLGVRAPRCQGAQGAGFLNPVGTSGTHGDRLALGDITPTRWDVGQADLVCLMGSSNDNVGLNAAYTDAALKTAVKAAIAIAQTDQPTAVIAVIGPLASFSPAAGAAEQSASRFTAMAEAVAEANDRRVVFIDNGPNGPSGRWLSSVNSATYVGTGGVHLNRAGVEYIGELEGSAIVAAITTALSA